MIFKTFDSDKDTFSSQFGMLKLIQEQHKEIEKLKQIIGGEVINEG